MRRGAAVIDEKVYLRNDFQVCVSCIASWRSCFDLSNDCNGLCKYVMVTGVSLQKKRGWFGMMLELPLFISWEFWACNEWVYLICFYVCSYWSDSVDSWSSLAIWKDFHNRQILSLVRTLVLWHSFNEVFFLQSQTFDNYLQIC